MPTAPIFCFQLAFYQKALNVPRTTSKPNEFKITVLQASIECGRQVDTQRLLMMKIVAD
jgi:hypothetical protein